MALLGALLLGAALGAPGDRRNANLASRNSPAVSPSASAAGNGGSASASAAPAPSGSSYVSSSETSSLSPPPALPPSPALPPPSPAPVRCAPPSNGDVSLTSYPSGTMLFYKDGSWGTVCRHYTQDTLDSAHVLCRQLGYELAIEQHIAEEDTSAYPINLWAAQCLPERGSRALAQRRSSRAEDDAFAGQTRVPRLADCHTHGCKHIHCGCTPEDALAVTCGGAYVPDYPMCGSAGALPPGQGGGEEAEAVRAAPSAAEVRTTTLGARSTAPRRRRADAGRRGLRGFGAGVPLFKNVCPVCLAPAPLTSPRAPCAPRALPIPPSRSCATRRQQAAQRRLARRLRPRHCGPCCAARCAALVRSSTAVAAGGHGAASAAAVRRDRTRGGGSGVRKERCSPSRQAAK